MAKNKKTTWFCLSCSYSETNHKHMDGCSCPKCGRPIAGRRAGDNDG